MASSSGPRFAIAGESDHGGYVCDRLCHLNFRCGPTRFQSERRMKAIRLVAITVLALTALTILGTHYLAPAGYEQQFRDTPQAAPSAHPLLGTDDLGRDRWARLLYGMRVSLTLAPLAALFTTVLAGMVAGIGQLAWQAAQARDLPLLVNLTMVVTFVTVCATLISDAAQRGFNRSAA